MTDKTIITRFAPSPTGNLHVGGARTALFNWAFARRYGGKFLLRIEDTDQKRSSEAALDGILRDLEWLGLDWDNPGEEPHQSKRLKLYKGYIDKLLADGIAYEDDGAVRFRMDHDIAFKDEVYGPIEVKAADLEDFVIKKADGFPTFHLAVVVDDFEMKITHVIRGQEHLSNTPKHIALQEALGFTRPIYAHTPSIMNPDGSKMSKRDKAKVARAAAKEHIQQIDDADAWIRELHKESVKFYEVAGHSLYSEEDIRNFLDKKNDEEGIATLIAFDLKIALPAINVVDFHHTGYLPEVLLNYIALLGWNPGENIERLTLKEIADNFSLDRIGKSNAKFDRNKLASFNGETLQAMSPNVYENILRERQQEYHLDYSDQLDNFSLFAQMYQPRCKTLEEPFILGRFIFHDDFDFNPKAVKKNLAKNDGQGLDILREFSAELEKLDSWQAGPINELIEAFVKEKSLKNMGSVAQPLRVAIKGDAVTPPIDQTLELLGKDETLKRIAACLGKYSS